ncbi:MAG: glycosyltransferase family 1 protein [Eubacterium sp.]|nr:glycosyltransferase family 1 protein [Eubacterium sp.]
MMANTDNDLRAIGAVCIQKLFLKKIKGGKRDFAFEEAQPDAESRTIDFTCEGIPQDAEGRTISFTCEGIPQDAEGSKKNHTFEEILLDIKGARRDLIFEEILLDETLIQGELWVSKKALSDVGGINHLLCAKKNYELLLRIAKKYRVVLITEGAEEQSAQENIYKKTLSAEQQSQRCEKALGVEQQLDQYSFQRLEPEIYVQEPEVHGHEQEVSGNKLAVHGQEPEVRENEQEVHGKKPEIYENEQEVHGKKPEIYENEPEIYGWKTDCYIISRYKSELLAIGCFDEAVKGVLWEGGGQAESYLEGMLSGSQEYYRIYDYTQPVLIYAGDEICYHVLDTFARNLGKALLEHGCSVIYFDMAKQPMEEITAFVRRRLKAVIGMQTYLFSAKKKDGSFIHDAIGAPEYYFVFDHPVWLRHHLTNVPKQMTVLTPDGNYAAFIEKYYKHPARFLPPAGQEQYYGQQNRVYDISFLGTYRDSLLDELKALRKNDKKRAYFINRFILYMRMDIAGTPERALEKLLEYYHMTYTDEEFEQQFFGVRWTILRLAHYYRGKVLKTLLQAGFTIHVFGDSWKECPLCAYEGLVCHEQAVGEQALQVYGSSKLSLNIMTWHKDGFTERIANAMLQRSVVVTDRTTYLEQNFVNEQELLIFGLDRINELPQKIKSLLEDDRRRAKIAESGYQKAKKEHTWYRRAGQLLELMDKSC